MKIQKFNESYKTDNYWVFKDDFLKIRKLTKEPVEGKILFRFYYEKYEDVCSMLYGCAKLLNTKYENNDQIRGITLGDYRKVNTSSINAILRLFCQNDEELAKRIKIKYSDDIYKIVDNAHNLGDVIDGLRIFYDKKIDILLKTKKYNL